MIKTVKKHTANEVFFGSSLVVLSSIFYGSYGIWTRLMGNSFGPFMQAWIRALLVIAILLPIALRTKRWQPIRWYDDRLKLAIFILVNTFIGASQYYAIVHIGIGLGLLTLYGGYLISMFVLGWIFNGEHYTGDKLAATVLALAGLTLTYGPSVDRTALIPFLAALFAGVCIGGEMLVTQKLKYSSIQTTILAWATGMVGTVPLAFLLNEKVPGLHAYAEWSYLLAFVAVCIAASWLSVHGVKLVEAGVAGILGLLEVVWGIAFGIIFFNERPELPVYIGAFCIIIAAAIPYVKDAKNSRVNIIEEMPT